MKALVFLLLLVCITAAVVPCCAVDNCSDETNTAASAENKKGDEGACSPFFTCASCPTGLVAAQSVQIEIPVIIALPDYPTHHSVVLSSYTSSFWQPPRLS